MQPYSHLVIAALLEKDICPTVPADYFWGSVAPDARISAGLRREQTHLAPQKILEFEHKYPQLKSFVQGYLVHCLSDNVDAMAILNRRIWLHPLLRRVSWQFVSTVIEAYQIEHRPLQKPIALCSNAMLSDLGIEPGHIEIEAKTMGPYLAKPTLAANLAFMKSGSGPRMRGYAQEAERIQTNPLIKPIWFGLANFEDFTNQVISQVRAHEAFKQISD
jgi:hypothetical protein